MSRYVPKRKIGLYKIGFRRGLLEIQGISPYNSPWFRAGVKDGMQELAERKLIHLLDKTPINRNDIKARHVTLAISRRADDKCKDA